MKFGVLRFPGSCDEVDAYLAASRVGDAEILWHADADLRGVDAVIVPGGFSYGDHLRVGAIARFAPVMVEVDRFARNGGLVLGICNGFQVLCEAGLLPGALTRNSHLHFRNRDQVLTVERALPALGFDGVTNVHVGRLVELDVDDPSQVAAMCEKLLANPLIEDYEIQ